LISIGTNTLYFTDLVVVPRSLPSVSLSAILQDPMALATIGVRPVARSLALSPLVQNRLAKNPNDISELLEILRTATPPAMTGLYSD